MEYQNIIILVDNKITQTSNFKRKSGLKQKMVHVELIILMTKSTLKLQCTCSN